VGVCYNSGAVMRAAHAAHTNTYCLDCCAHWSNAAGAGAAPLAQEDCNRIKVFLRDILSIDEENLVIRTEPLVDMRYMTRYLVPKGYQLAIQVRTHPCSCTYSILRSIYTAAVFLRPAQWQC
jgi:hypothetical protein